MALNWGDTKKAIDESRRSSRRTRRFQIRDGESVSIRFLGDEKEPFIYKRHFDNRNNRYIICAEDAVINGKHKGCVACYEAKRQGKQGQMRMSTRTFAFTIYDPRKFHFVESNPEKEKYQNCKDDPTCRWCRKGIEQRTNGVCNWSLAGTVAEQLQVFERDLLGQKCAICQLGTIKVKQYVCPECDTELDVDDPYEERRCFECGTKTKVVMVKPREVVACSRGCKNARRTTLADAFVIVTRSGEAMNTAYNFSPGDIGPIPSDWKDASPLDFAHDPEFLPLPANEQAAAIGIANPFRDPKGDEPDDDIPFSKASASADKDDADANIFRR
jgi:hypothetical protein